MDLGASANDPDDDSEEASDTPSFQQRCGLVHRIDKETSGLLVIAKNEDAGTSLSRQFFHKTTRRLYTALVWGHVEADEGVIEGNIGRNKKTASGWISIPLEATRASPP